ncbi:MAG TPA: hypothetical protein VEX68_01980 [Bryobacteraceae bacterium]|nr:hypothetical protein [Bryobacteraceae bacterium]
MKRFASTTALFVAIAGFSMHAQTLNLRASIPFDFRVGKVLMPAGDYDIYRTGEVVRVRSENGTITGAMFLTLPTTGSEQRTLGGLEFNRYDDTYFLAKIFSPYSKDGRAFPKSAQEKALVARGATVQTAAVVTRQK